MLGAKRLPVHSCSNTSSLHLPKDTAQGAMIGSLPDTANPMPFGGLLPQELFMDSSTVDADSVGKDRKSNTSGPEINGHIAHITLV